MARDMSATTACDCKACRYGALLAEIPPRLEPTHESEPRVILVSGAHQTGALLSVISSTPFTEQVGDMFVIEGCYAVNPISHATTTHLQRFVVTLADPAYPSDHSGQRLLNISPPIMPRGPYQNVNASPLNGARLHPLDAGGANLSA